MVLFDFFPNDLRFSILRDEGRNKQDVVESVDARLLRHLTLPVDYWPGPREWN